MFSFDAKRKRQSVVLFDGKNYKLYVKGADSSIISNLNRSFSHPYLKNIEDYLQKFSLLGYRTLVFAVRYLSVDEYKDIRDRYQRAMNSGDRASDLADLAEQIEVDLTLLGMTAVEDSLQKRVKETITRLLEANIKVWMITGDKLETAHNIAIMAGIVSHQMDIYRLDGFTESQFMAKAQRLIEKINKQSKTHRKVAIIFDMRLVGKRPKIPWIFYINFFLLDFIFKEKSGFEMESEKLANLLMKADSVVCARSTPKQKAKIVNFVRKRGKICLAIGDGANDVNMIQVSNHSPN